MTRKDVIEFGSRIGTPPYRGDKKPSLMMQAPRITRAIGELGFSQAVADGAIRALIDVTNWDDPNVAMVLKAYERRSEDKKLEPKDVKRGWG